MVVVKVAVVKAVVVVKVVKVVKVVIEKGITISIPLPLVKML